MLVINTVDDFNDAMTKIRTAPMTMEARAERFMELYRAVNQCQTRTADGRHMLFSYMSTEYMMARWFFRTSIAMAYPDVNPDKVYSEWLATDQHETVHECVSVVRRRYGTEYVIWEKFIDGR